jgi:hypothetical protein
MKLTDKQLKELFEVKTDKSGIVWLTFFKEVFDEDDNYRLAQLVTHDLEKAMDAQPGKKLNGIIDLRKLPTGGKMSPKAQKVYSKTMSDVRIHKVAFIGLTTLKRIMVSFVMAATHLKGFALFENEKDAIAWLNKE